MSKAQKDTKKDGTEEKGESTKLEKAREIDHYEKIIDRVDKEIQHVHRVYYLLAGILGLIMTAGIAAVTILTWNTLGDARESVRQETQEMKSSLEEEVGMLKQKAEEMKSSLEKEVGMLRQEVQRRVEREFDKEEIQQLVREEAMERIDAVADQFIEKEIDKKVTPVISGVEKEMGVLDNALLTIQERLKHIVETTEKRVEGLEKETEETLNEMKTESEFLLTLLRAQHGEKESWVKLFQIAEKEQETERGRFAGDTARRIYDKFFIMQDARRRHYGDGVSDSSVVKSLKHRWSHRRKMAVYTVKERSMHDQIPALISMIELEENLDVLGVIFRVLNELLGTDLHYADTNALRSFEEAWEVKKKELEETRGEHE